MVLSHANMEESFIGVALALARYLLRKLRACEGPRILNLLRIGLY